MLAKLFPENLKDLTLFVQQEMERFRAQEEHIRSIWAKRTFLTADYWFSLVIYTEQVLKRYNVMLHRSTRVFSDQLFDGHNAILLINCLVEYADREECNPKLNEAIHLLFGHDKMIVTS